MQMGLLSSALIPLELRFATLAIGLWMIAIGYYFLSFVYIFTNRYLYLTPNESHIS